MSEARGYTILINSQSGTVLKMGPEGIRQTLQESGLPVAALHIVPPDEFSQKIKTYEHSASNPLLIGGGDGTIRSCAEVLMEKGYSFGILPLGTMNLMARDLGIPVELGKALAAYAQGDREMKIDVGTVNDIPFLCCVGLGTMPESSEFREENRDQSVSFLMPRLMVFILGEMEQRRHRRVRMNVDGRLHRLRTAALVIANNQYDAPEEWGEQNNFKRRTLSGGTLGIYSAAPSSLWDRLRLLLRLGLGGWKGDPAIREWSGKKIELHTGQTEELLSLDGETIKMQGPLCFRIRPAALSVLTPRQAQDKKDAA